VTCHNCRSEWRKFGKRGNRQRHQCTLCRKVFTDARDNTLDGMYLPIEKLVLKLLLEGNSVSSVVRPTDVHQKTILKLLVLASEKSERIMAEKIRNVPVTEIQADEVWQLVGCKQRRRVLSTIPPGAIAGRTLRSIRFPNWSSTSRLEIATNRRQTYFSKACGWLRLAVSNPRPMASLPTVPAS